MINWFEGTPISAWILQGWFSRQLPRWHWLDSDGLCSWRDCIVLQYWFSRQLPRWHWLDRARLCIVTGWSLVSNTRDQHDGLNLAGMIFWLCADSVHNLAMDSYWQLSSSRTAVISVCDAGKYVVEMTLRLLNQHYLRQLPSGTASICWFPRSSTESSLVCRKTGGGFPFCAGSGLVPSTVSLLLKLLWCYAPFEWVDYQRARSQDPVDSRR